jgi:hypothetical protein
MSIAPTNPLPNRSPKPWSSAFPLLSSPDPSSPFVPPTTFQASKVSTLSNDPTLLHAQTCSRNEETPYEVVKDEVKVSTEKSQSEVRAMFVDFLTKFKPWKLSLVDYAMKKYKRLLKSIGARR